MTEVTLPGGVTVSIVSKTRVTNILAIRVLLQAAGYTSATDFCRRNGIERGAFSRMLGGWIPPEPMRSRIAALLGSTIDVVYPMTRVGE